jgi:hypothetical protein
LLVIGVTGFVAYTVLVPDGDSSPPKAEPKPSTTNKVVTATTAEALRNPFRMKQSEDAEAATNATAASPGSNDPAEAVAKANPADQPALSVEDDKILETMKLVGTFVDRREQLAIIDNKVYARGDSLRGVDGAALPYIVTEVHKDRALVRRGRRDFIIGFSDVPRTAVPKAAAPAKSANEKPAAKTETLAKASPVVKDRSGSTDGPETVKPQSSQGSASGPSPGSVNTIADKNGGIDAMKDNGP